jgi:alpha-L-rhamnosidase
MKNVRFERKLPISEKIQWHPDLKKIWHPDYAVYYENPRNQFCCFRKTFELNSVCVESELRIIVDTKYKLFVNGKFVGRGPCRFDLRWACYDIYDIAPYLQKGGNVIAVLALHHGYGTGAQASSIQMLMVQAELKLENHKTLYILSDTSWKTSLAKYYDTKAMRLNGRLGPMEIQDMRKYNSDWCMSDFKEKSWKTCAEIKMRSWWNILPRQIPMLTEELCCAKNIIASGHGNLLCPSIKEMGIYRDKINWDEMLCNKTFPATYDLKSLGKPLVVNIDFSLILAGFLEIDINAESGFTVDVLYAEELVNGIVPMPGGSVIPADRFILKAGNNYCEINFGWKAFRYVQLWLWGSGKVTINRTACRRIGYPTPKPPRWEIKDQQVSKIIKLAENSLKLCMQDGFLDSSSREQQQWIGDGRIQALAAACYYGETKLWKQMLTQMVQSQDHLGAMMPRHPGQHNNIQPIPSFMLDWILSNWDYYCFTGDEEVLKLLWNNMVQLMRWFSPFENTDGLLEDVPHWMFIDWGGMDIERKGIITGLNCKYLYALTLMAKMAEIVNDFEAAKFYTGKYLILPEKIFEKCYNPSKKAFSDCAVKGELSEVISEATNALAILYLPLPEDLIDSVVKNVFEHYNDIVKSSPGFIINVGRALNKAGRKKLALDLYKKRFEKLINSDATAMWELWDLYHVKENVSYIDSASHGWGAGFLVFYAEAFLGYKFRFQGILAHY